MSEIILPRWNSRHDVRREDRSHDFSDIAGVMVNNYYFYELIYKVVAPYEARQRDIDEFTGERLSPYVPPSVEFLLENIRKPSFISAASHAGACRGVAAFCEYNRGMFALPVPHPTTIHSIQLPKGAFTIERQGAGHVVTVAGCKARFYIQGLNNHAKVKFMVLRPKSSASGTPNLSHWELLTFDEDHGYIPLWVDSTANPRFAGNI